MWLLKKVHTYAGLLAFIKLAVYEAVGLSVTFLRHSSPPASVITYQDFYVAPNLTDRQVAERVCARLMLSLATPVNSAAIQHDANNNLFLDFRHANGRHQVTVLEKEGRLPCDDPPEQVVQRHLLHRDRRRDSQDHKQQLPGDTRFHPRLAWNLGPGRGPSPTFAFLNEVVGQFEKLTS